MLSTLGDTTVVPQLLQLLVSGAFDSGVSRKVALSIERLADDIATVETLTSFLAISDIPDATYQALGAVSRRAGVRLYLHDGSGFKKSAIRIVKEQHFNRQKYLS